MFYRKHKRVQLDTGEGLTRQEFKAECDVNVIMSRYQRTGIMPGNPAGMRYGDFTELPNFMDAMNTVARANEAFAALPAAIRRRFGNDPGEYVDFVSNPENLDEVRKLGLAEAAPKAPEPVPAPAPPPAA